MKKATFIVPKRDNQGKPFPRATILSIQQDILEQYGGYTVRSVEGGWLDPSTGKVYEEENWEYSIALDESKLAGLIAWLEKQKVILRQETMYLEVTDAKVLFV